MARFLQQKLNVIQSIQRFLHKYGFRCINELKLEESTLHDDPSFVVDTLQGYVRTQSYSIASMEQRELAIRRKAEGWGGDCVLHAIVMYVW